MKNRSDCRNPIAVRLKVFVYLRFRRGLRLVSYRKLTPPDAEPNLEPSEYALGEALRDLGYRTAHVGKWHIGPGHSSMFRGLASGRMVII